MKNKRIFSLLAILLFGLVPVKAQANGDNDPVIVHLYPVENGSGFGDVLTTRNAVGGIAVLAVMAGLYKLYRWYYQEPSNAELRENAQKVYDRLDTTYSKLTLRRYPAKMNLTNEGDLLALAKRKDMKKIKNIFCDRPGLRQQIALLGERIAKDEKADKCDNQMKDLHARMITLRNALDAINQFWHTHAVFFSTHQLLTELSRAYNQYDCQNISEVKKLIRNNSVGQHYPFKTFAETLAQNIDSLQNRIKKLRKNMKAFSGQSAIASDYYNIVSQAETFCHALIPIRNIVANFDEYASDVRQCNEDWHKQQQRAAQVRAAELRAEAERANAREQAEAAREKAEAIRYKARLKLMQNKQRKQQITVVVQNPNNNQNQ